MSLCVATAMRSATLINRNSAVESTPPLQKVCTQSYLAIACESMWGAQMRASQQAFAAWPEPQGLPHFLQPDLRHASGEVVGLGRHQEVCHLVEIPFRPHLEFHPVALCNVDIVAKQVIRAACGTVLMCSTHLANYKLFVF